MTVSDPIVPDLARQRSIMRQAILLDSSTPSLEVPRMHGVDEPTLLGPLIVVEKSAKAAP